MVVFYSKAPLTQFAFKHLIFRNKVTQKFAGVTGLQTQENLGATYRRAVSMLLISVFSVFLTMAFQSFNDLPSLVFQSSIVILEHGEKQRWYRSH